MLLHAPAQTLLLSVTALSCLWAAHGKARFLSHVPYDEERELFDAYEDDHSYDDIHDSITKLRGRHYPKLSYTQITDTHKISHLFPQFSQTSDTDPRLRFTSQSPETAEMEGPRMLPLGTPHQEGGRRYSKYPERSSSLRYPNARNSNRFEEYSPGYSPAYPRHLPPHSQNDEEHRQAGEKWKSSADDGGEPAVVEEDLGPSPRFARTMKRNVTARSGGIAELVCQVVNLHQQSVSWIRQSNLNILTVDTFRYSTDMRLSVQHRRLRHQEWVLQIRNVTELDSGLYECQISTTPLLSYVVNLVVSAHDAPPAPAPGKGYSDTASPTRPRVEEPRAEFAGGTALLLQRGAPMSLECLVTHPTNTPARVNWYHQDQILYPSVESMGTEQTPNQPHRHHSKAASESLDSGEGFPDYPTDDTKSYDLAARYAMRDAPARPSQGRTLTRFSLLVGLATDGRAGRYTCEPVGGKNASVEVNIVAGSDLSAQLLTGSSPGNVPSLLTAVLSLASAMGGLMVLT